MSNSDWYANNAKLKEALSLHNRRMQGEAAQIVEDARAWSTFADQIEEAARSTVPSTYSSRRSLFFVNDSMAGRVAACDLTEFNFNFNSIFEPSDSGGDGAQTHRGPVPAVEEGDDGGHEGTNERDPCGEDAAQCSRLISAPPVGGGAPALPLLEPAWLSPQPKLPPGPRTTFRRGRFRQRSASVDRGGPRRVKAPPIVERLQHPPYWYACNRPFYG
jgi:hypothetical protein